MILVGTRKFCLKSNYFFFSCRSASLLIFRANHGFLKARQKAGSAGGQGQCWLLENQMEGEVKKFAMCALLKVFSLACAYENSRIRPFHVLSKTETSKGLFVFRAAAGCPPRFPGICIRVVPALRSTSERELEKRWWSWKNNKLSAGGTEHKLPLWYWLTVSLLKTSISPAAKQGACSQLRR